MSEKAFLATDPVFEGLRPYARKRRLAKKQQLFQDGELPEGAYAVLRGSLKLFKSGSDGEEHILSLTLPGSFLGLRALIADEPYSASAMAREESELFFYDASHFRKFLAENPAAARAAFAMLGRQLRVAREGLFERSATAAPARLAHCLALLEQQFNLGGKIRVSGQELASMIGVTPETVSRQLKALEKQGLVSHVAREIRVKNRAGLLQLSGGTTGLQGQ